MASPPASNNYLPFGIQQYHLPPSGLCYSSTVVFVGFSLSSPVRYWPQNQRQKDVSDIVVLLLFEDPHTFLYEEPPAEARIKAATSASNSSFLAFARVRKPCCDSCSLQMPGIQDSTRNNNGGVPRSGDELPRYRQDKPRTPGLDHIHLVSKSSPAHAGTGWSSLFVQ